MQYEQSSDERAGEHRQDRSGVSQSPWIGTRGQPDIRREAVNTPTPVGEIVDMMATHRVSGLPNRGLTWRMVRLVRHDVATSNTQSSRHSAPTAGPPVRIAVPPRWSTCSTSRRNARHVSP